MSKLCGARSVFSNGCLPFVPLASVLISPPQQEQNQTYWKAYHVNLQEDFGF